MKNLFFTRILAAALSVCFITAFPLISANAAENTDNGENSGVIEDLYITDNGGDIILPSSYSSVDNGYVTEVKSQKYKDCWAYASLSCLESKLLREGFETGSMSEEHLNLWATPHSDGTGWQRSVSSDGYSDIALGYMMSWQGGIESSTYDEVSSSEQFTSDALPSDLAKYGVTSIKYLNGSDFGSIKSSIIDNGSVYASYSQSALYTSKDMTSYFCPEGSAVATGHAIAVVGWDDNYSKENFKAVNGVIPENDGAWLIKNSWGDYNSLDGYFWISYEDAYLFDDRYKPVYTIESVMEIDGSIMLMQNEIYGATYEFDYLADEDVMTYINMYNFSEGFNELESVIFETQSCGADFEIFYIPVRNEIPVNDESQWTLLYSGTVPYSGYIYADLDNFALPVTYGAIAVRIDASAINENAEDDTQRTKNSIGVGEWLDNDKGYVFKNDSKYGDSFIYCGGAMIDLLKWYSDERDDNMGGTFVIKAVTRQTGADITLSGDSDLNGVLDINDATAVQRYLAGHIEFSAVQKLNADFNGDGIVDINDVTQFQMYLAGYGAY